VIGVDRHLDLILGLELEPRWKLYRHPEQPVRLDFLHGHLGTGHVYARAGQHQQVGSRVADGNRRA
jgi:hypothetical protein